MRNSRMHKKRQDSSDPTALPTISGVNGVSSVGNIDPTATGLLFDPSALSTTISAPPLAGVALTITSGTSSATPTSTPSTSTDSAALSQSSQISVGTVVAACVGSFAGLALLICIFLWWFKRHSKRSADRDTHENQDKGNWNKLGDDQDRWESMPKVQRKESQQEIDEKNFSMFKKTNSMRTTRTARALEEHGFDLPPFEFSKYHPNLAEELALPQPAKPFVQRQDSGISWDGETVGDDSFLSLRSVRVESGTMSPTPAMAKMTPPATTSDIHKWESAEVLTMDESIAARASKYDPSDAQNPFADVSEERPKSSSNPFFSAGDMYRSSSRVRSRSNSLTSRRSRSASRTSRATTRTEVQNNPFTDDAEASAVPVFRTHIQSDSVASGSSGHAFTSDHALKSLIAALDLTQEQVEERLRVASMQASTISRYSGVSSIVAADDESDLGTIRGFPIPPSS